MNAIADLHNALVPFLRAALGQATYDTWCLTAQPSQREQVRAGLIAVARARGLSTFGNDWQDALNNTGPIPPKAPPASTCVVPVWLAARTIFLGDLHTKSQDWLASHLQFTTQNMGELGWIEAGAAEVVITLKSRRHLLAGAAATMRQTSAALLAKAKAEADAIDASALALLATEAA